MTGGRSADFFSAMESALNAVGSLCTHIPADPAGGIVLGLFLAGLAGSATHCGPMCGGFVLCQVSDRMAGIPAVRIKEWHRVRAATLAPYHLGRITSYAALGLLAGSGRAVLGHFPLSWALPGVLLLCAAAVFLAQGFGLLPESRGFAQWTRSISRLARGHGGFLLGMALGFLPCGFLFAALIAAASAGPALGALGMMAFGLGTVPALLAVGFAGHMAGTRFRKSVMAARPAIVLANTGLLLILATLSLRGP